MQVTTVKNPWETSFETGTTQVVKMVKKKIAGAAQAVVGDVKQQMTGSGQDKSFVEQMGVKPVAVGQAKQIQDDQARKLAAMRQNLAQIDVGVKRAREERLGREGERAKVEEQQKQQKKAVEEKKKQEPVWQQALKSSQGSGERRVNAGG